MPFVNTTTGRDHSINEPRNAYRLDAHDLYRGRIELEASVTITLRHFEDDEDFGTEWWATASRDTDHQYAGGVTSRTVGTASGFTKRIALDNLAKQMGVFERVNPPATGERLGPADAVELGQVAS